MNDNTKVLAIGFGLFTLSAILRNKKKKRISNIPEPIAYKSIREREAMDVQERYNHFFEDCIDMGTHIQCVVK